MRQTHHKAGRICPLYHRAIELVGKRWTGAVIHTLLDGPQRFSEILGQVPGLHDRLLAERLKELESEGVVTRRVYPDIPVRIEYELTGKGRDLQRVVAEMHRWADRWVVAPAR